MEILETKINRLTAAPTVESFFPFGPIEHIARKILTTGILAAHRINSAVVSKLSVKGKEDPTYLSSESSYSDHIEQESELYLMANNPKTSPSLLDHISINSTTAISEAIAMNDSTSRATLRRLANHTSPLVRAAVTENAYTPFEVLSILCEDEHPDVRFTMAENPDVPESLLVKLTIDDNPYVASRACSTLKRLNGDVII